MQVSHRGVNVGGFHRITAREVNRVQRLREPEQIVEIVLVAFAAATSCITDIRRARHRSEGDRVTPDM